jgi:hypothetical protein
MAFDSSKPHGMSLGGKTHGMKVQNGRIYRSDDSEVDESGNVLHAPPAEVKAAPPKAAAVVKAALPAQVLAQLPPKE